MQVFLSPLAEFKVQMILDYLESEWTAQVRETFLKQLIQSLNHISTYPYSFSQTEEFPGVYKCVVNRHNSLFYRIKADEDEVEVEVITVIDNRQNPHKVREELTKHFE